MYRSQLMLLTAAAIAVTFGVTKDLQNPPHGPGGSTSDILIAEETIPQTQQGSDKTPPVPGAKEGETAQPSNATDDKAGTKSDKQPDSKALPQ